MFGKLLLEILMKVLPGMSAQIREDILEFLKKAEAHAKETQNPLDDILIMILRIVLGF